jgi:short-subunit dehydrogenase
MALAESSDMESTDMSGKVVVVTGASSGFGKGTALELARRGAAVVLAARRGHLLDEVARGCLAAGGQAIAVATDVSRQGDVESLAQRALATFQRIDVWINNAGVGALGPFERIPLEDHVQVIATNLLGTLYGSYRAYRYFVGRGSGILINVASELGRHTVPYYSSYAAAKHGVVALSEALRQELRQNEIDDVHVCLVMPTAHDTPFFDHAANYTGHQVQAPTPLHDPQDVVQTLVRLVEDPEDREIVGADGVIKILLRNLAPALEERIAARHIHRTQMEQAPPAADSPGAVRSPMPQGTGISAGRRKAG